MLLVSPLLLCSFELDAALVLGEVTGIVWTGEASALVDRAEGRNPC